MQQPERTLFSNVVDRLPMATLAAIHWAVIHALLTKRQSTAVSIHDVVLWRRPAFRPDDDDDDGVWVFPPTNGVSVAVPVRQLGGYRVAITNDGRRGTVDVSSSSLRHYVSSVLAAATRTRLDHAQRLRATLAQLDGADGGGTEPPPHNLALVAGLLEMVTPLSAPWSPERTGFARLTQTADTGTVVLALGRLRAHYPALYAFAPRWFDPARPDIAQARQALLAVPRNEERSARFLEMTRRWLTGQGGGDASSYTTLLPNAATVWPAVAADLARLLHVDSVVAPEFSNLGPLLLVVRLLDADLRRVMDGCARAVVRVHPLPGTRVRYPNAPPDALGKSQVMQVVRAYLALQDMRVRWPLAVCLNLATAHDMLVVPTPPTLAATTMPLTTLAMSDAAAGKDEAHGYRLWTLEPYGAFSLEHVYRAHIHRFEPGRVAPSARERARLPVHFQLTLPWLANVLYQVTFAVRAAAQLAGVVQNDWARKHVLFTDMRDTPYADRPWAFRMRRQGGYALVAPEVHGNYLVKLIDFGMTEITDGVDDDDATITSSEADAVLTGLRLPSMLAALAGRDARVLAAVDAYVALYDDEAASALPDVTAHALYTVPLADGLPPVLTIAADALAARIVRVVKDAVGVLDSSVPVLVGYVPDDATGPRIDEVASGKHDRDPASDVAPVRVVPSNPAKPSSEDEEGEDGPPPPKRRIIDLTTDD